MQCLQRRLLRKYRSHDLVALPYQNHVSVRNQHRHLIPVTTPHGRRYFISNIPAVLVPPVIFVGLGVGLWTWKCCMMVLFQNKIIYMPGLPPNARREKISDYSRQTVGVAWREVRIKSSDGTEIALCVAATKSQEQTLSSPVVYILYFQGNASSIPPRLPFLSPIVKSLEADAEGNNTRYVFVCVSYRGYWTSEGRANEAGISRDALSALSWISSQHEGLHPATVVVWGQSIGAGVASTLTANHEPTTSNVNIKGLILETPFTNIRDMLVTLYPQKWLPYRYLWPFLRNHLDSLAALSNISGRFTVPPEITIIEAGKDELVPTGHGEMLQKKCEELRLKATKYTVKGALHTEVMALPEGRKVIVDAIRRSSM